MLIFRFDDFTTHGFIVSSLKKEQEEEDNMFNEQEYETKVRCPDCGKPMYALKGALNPIYICSYCGASIDHQTLQQKKEMTDCQNNGGKTSLLRNLFSNQFMKKYTDFKDFTDFINHCNFFNHSIESISKETLSEIPDRKINKYVRKHTCFSTWDQMFEKAVEWYLKM